MRYYLKLLKVEKKTNFTLLILTDLIYDRPRLIARGKNRDNVFSVVVLFYGEFNGKS